MIIEEEVWVKWHHLNRAHFEALGYIYSGRYEQFLVKSTELLPGSSVYVNASCDDCGKIRTCRRSDYAECCYTCGNKKIIETKRLFFKDEEKSKEYRNSVSKRMKEYYKDPEAIARCVKNAKADYHLKLGREENRKARSKQCIERNTGKFGPDHPAWNPDRKDSERNKKRSYTEYYLWQNEILKRDNKICQCCYKKFKNSAGTRCHHLDGYAWAIDRRHDPENGILLCVKCHNDFHHTYGIKNVTKEMFFEHFWKINGGNFNSLVEILKYNKVKLYNTLLINILESVVSI